MREVEAPEKYDTLDLRLLTELGNGNYGSLDSLAKRLGLPPATVHRRVRALSERGVLARTVHRLDLNALGIRRHRVLVGVRNASAAVTGLLEDFAHKSRNVINLSRLVGAWDYDLSFEHFSELELLESLQLLGDALKEELLETEVSSVLRYHKFSTSPLDMAR
jgi:DNA-binding Lrp family transcriptional regulator